MSDGNVWAVQHISDFESEHAAREAFAGIAGQDGCYGALVLGPGAGKHRLEGAGVL